MSLKDQVNELLEKRMDRQDFLKTVALSVVAVSGVGTVFRTLTPRPEEDRVTIASAYGGGAYGGVSDKKLG